MTYWTSSMADAFQVEFPLNAGFQSKLKSLHMRFQASAKESLRLKAVLSLCLHALQDVTPELIALHSSIMDADDKREDARIYRKTSNLLESDRVLLDKIRIHLLTNFDCGVTRKDIVNTIILVAHDLKDAQISYILSEYH